MKRHECWRSAPNQKGFTLLELLTATVVLGIAVSIYLQLFASSLSLAEQSSKSRTAARLAEETLTAIEIAPRLYDWPRYEEAEAGELIPLPRRGIGTTHITTARTPTAEPTRERSHQRTMTHYGDFTTETYTSVPDFDANHVRVVVVVRWMTGGRVQAFSLTSALPRGAVEG